MAHCRLLLWSTPQLYQWRNKTLAPQISSKYKRNLVDTLPKFRELFTEQYYESEYKDDIEIKPRHIPGCEGDDNFHKFYKDYFVDNYTK